MSCLIFHFTLLQVAALALFIISFCPAQSESSPSCANLLDPNSNLPSERKPDHTLNLFKNLSLSDRCSSFTFNITCRDELDEAPSLAFILVRSASANSGPSLIVQSAELCFDHVTDQPCSHPWRSLDVCNPNIEERELHIQLPSTCSRPEQDAADHSDETEVSLSYDAGAKQIHGKAVQYSHERKNNRTFSFSTNDTLPADAIHSTVSNEITTLFVGYIARKNATGIRIVNENATVCVASADGSSNHKKVVVWVIVGVSVMVFLMGLLILVLFITKRRGRRPSLVPSRPARHGTSRPSAPPFSHHALESTATPMMKALPLSPPHTSAFQISGTASWLKQPNPR